MNSSDVEEWVATYTDREADELEARILIQPLLNSSEALLDSYGFAGSVVWELIQAPNARLFPG